MRLYSRILLAFLLLMLCVGPALADVKSHQKISDTEGNLGGTLDDEDSFGVGLTNLGNLDSDGVQDLAVGAQFDDDGGTNRGAVWVLFLNSDGTVKSHQKISDTEGNFTGTLDDRDAFGNGIACLGDLDSDGRTDVAVGAHADDDGGTGRGAIWMLDLNSDGTVDSHQKISDTEGGFTGTLDNEDGLGHGMAALGDVDGDGVQDLAVGATNDDDGGTNSEADRGAVWVLFLNTNGTVKSQQKISDTEGGFTGTLNDIDDFGWAIAGPGDLDGDGVPDLLVGAIRDDDGGGDRGAVWLLALNSDGTVKGHSKISDTAGGFSGVLDNTDNFGTGVTNLGDLNQDGVQDLVAGANGDDDGGTNRGAVWVMFLEEPLHVFLESFGARVEGNGVRLTWKTKSEINNVGFRILRERARTGRRTIELEHTFDPVVISPQLIPSRGNELSGAEYEYLDAGRQGPGAVLYYLEDIDIWGRATRHGPVIVRIESKNLSPERSDRFPKKTPRP